MSSSPVSDSPSIEPLRQALAAWRQQVDSELKGVPFEKKLLTRTPEGITLQPLYSRLDTRTMPHLHAAPGTAPFGRGFRRPVEPQRWECAQEISADTPSDFNRALRQDLNAGQNAVTLTPDLAARAGLDPVDCPAGWMGKGGLSLSSAEEVEAALRGVDLAAVPLHVSAGANPLGLAALVLAELRARGQSFETLHGSLTADPVGHAVVAGELPGTWSEAMDQLAGWTRWGHAHVPGLRTVGIDASLWREAGGSATHELAYALASARYYLTSLLERNVTLEQACSALRVTFAADASFFVEIAKFRAWRILWTKLVVALGAPAELAASIAVHARTARWNHSLLDPQVNLLRSTTAALSAVLGGVDSLHVAPWDEVTGRTHDASRRIARNVHTLLAEEFRMTSPIDAAGGSWYVETVTDELARKAWSLFQEVERAGGMVPALERGLPQTAVHAAATERDAAFATRKQVLIGTNLYPNAKDKVDLKLRSGAAGATARGAGAKVAIPGPKPWPDCLVAAIAAARDGATIGQLARLAGFGPATLVPPLTLRRAAEPFERLRARAAALKERPKVFLAKMGPAAQHKARADFSAGFFSVAGFELSAKQSFDAVDEAVKAAVDANARVVVLCSTDETYPELVPAFAKGVKAQRPEVQVILAGLPAEPSVREAFRAAGVDEFIHVRASATELLGKLLNRYESHS